MDDRAATTLQFGGLDELLGYRIRRAQGAMHRDYMAAVTGLKLTQKQTAVLWLVEANPGVGQGEVGAALGMDRATMMTLVHRLEERGLVARRRSRSDARRRELHSTEAGARLLARARRRIAVHEQRMREKLSDSEFRTLCSLLRRLAG